MHLPPIAWLRTLNSPFHARFQHDQPATRPFPFSKPISTTPQPRSRWYRPDSDPMDALQDPPGATSVDAVSPTSRHEAASCQVALRTSSTSSIPCWLMRSLSSSSTVSLPFYMASQVRPRSRVETANAGHRAHSPLDRLTRLEQHLRQRGYGLCRGDQGSPHPP